MSDALIASQQGEINRLNKELAETRAEAKKHRVEKAGLRKQVETLTSERDGLTTERDGLQSKLTAAPSELQAKLDEATGKLRTRDHQDAWTAALGGELADKAAVADLWQKVGYQPESDQVDPKQITELVGKAREAAPYLFKTADSAVAQTSATDSRESKSASRLTLPASGDAAGRGAPAKAPGMMQVHKRDMQDPRIALDPQNIAARQQAHKEGRLQILE
jgi:hypothetical protein